MHCVYERLTAVASGAGFNLGISCSITVHFRAYKTFMGILKIKISLIVSNNEIWNKYVPKNLSQSYFHVIQMAKLNENIPGCYAWRFHGNPEEFSWFPLRE